MTVGRLFACHYCPFASFDAEATFQHMFDRHRAVRGKSTAAVVRPNPIPDPSTSAAGGATETFPDGGLLRVG